MAADHLRHQRSRPRLALGDDWQCAAERAQPRLPGTDDNIALRHALAGLARERQEAFVLTQVIGLSYAEAAEICGCRLGTIRSRVARARDDLRAALTTSTKSSAADR